MSSQRWSVYDRHTNPAETLSVMRALVLDGQSLDDLRDLLLYPTGFTLMEVIDRCCPLPHYDFEERDNLLGLLVEATGWNMKDWAGELDAVRTSYATSKLWPTFDGTGYALVIDPEDGPCTIVWIDGEKLYATGDLVDGFIVGDKLFYPGREQSDEGDYITRDGQPDPDAPWSDVETGRRALVGLPGSPLTVLE